MQEFDFQLPEGIDEKDLIPDPHKRVGHWYHPETDQVFFCPIGWAPAKPEELAKPEEPAKDKK